VGASLVVGWFPTAIGEGLCGTVDDFTQLDLVAASPGRRMPGSSLGQASTSGVPSLPLSEALHAYPRAIRDIAIAHVLLMDASGGQLECRARCGEDASCSAGPSAHRAAKRVRRREEYGWHVTRSETRGFDSTMYR
jgi:hypothetical protein